jgi:hypothetical protein
VPVDQALDADAYFAAQVSPRPCTCRLRRAALDFGLGQRLDLGRRIDAGGDADLLRPRAADTENTLQTDTDVFLYRTACKPAMRAML